VQPFGIELQLQLNAVDLGFVIRHLYGQRFDDHRRRW
jgi:hypothetical protein